MPEVGETESAIAKKSSRSSLVKQEDEAAFLKRAKFSLVGMSALGALAIAVPYVSSGWLAALLSAVVMAAISVSAGAVWWQMNRAKRDLGEERLLREAFHSVLTPQLITGRDGALVLANRAFQGWIDLADAGAMDALMARLGSTKESAAEFSRMKENLAKGQSVIADLPVLRGSRITEWRRVIARPIDGNGKFFHWRFEDISERRRMEKAMRDEQNKLLDFMAHAPVGIYSVDQHGRFRFVNETLASWLQGNPDEFVKGDVRLHDVLRDQPKDIPSYAIANGPNGELRGEVVMRRRDGQLFPAAITQTIVKSEDGKTLRTRSIVRDLSPEREWQIALSLSEYRFQRLFAEAPIGILLLDSRMSVTECNHSFQAITGRPREAVINLPISALISRSDRDSVTKRLAEVLGGANMSKPMEVRLEAGREIVAQVFAKRFDASVAKSGDAASAEVESGQGQPESPSGRGLMLYFIDATEQKKLEMQFAHSQKMQAIGQLAGGVAHDFNNLLTAMIGFCDLLLQRHKPGDQSFGDIMQIKQNGERAATLVRQLLAFSRQQTLQPKVMSPADVLSDLSNMLGRLIGGDVKMDVTLGRDLGVIKVDKGQLEQVMMNLIVNARDAMMPQGGIVKVHADNYHQKEPVMRGQDEMPAGDYIAIHVSDTGSGIPKENLQRIFEPFFSTKEVGSGTGLGLSTVYGIVRQTGGFIGVDTKIGRGTTFSVYLPSVHPEEAAKIVQSEPAIEEKSTPDLTGVETIMLVEDEDAVRVFSSRALKNKGYNVLEARSGEEALTILKREGDRVALIVTDVVMPQMDGPTLYKNIRERWPNMKVIFVSGYTEDRLRDQFKSGETIHFLGKPFTLKLLASKVKEVLGTA